MNPNYECPSIDRAWADSRKTHIAVATAIHSIAHPRRSADDIWSDPTPAEWDHVTMAVEQYIADGEFFAEDDGRYSWGAEAITLETMEG